MAKPRYRAYDKDDDLTWTPLGAHLPLAPESQKEASKLLYNRLDFDPSERDARTSIRMRKVENLKELYVPADPEYSRFLRELINAVHVRYARSNPLSAQGQQAMYGRGSSETTGYKSNIYLLTGYSGMGKSRLVDRLLASLGERLVQHTSFRGKPFPEAQIVWLRRNVPPNCNVSRLLRTFGAEADRVLGMEFYGPSFNRLPDERGDQDTYLEELLALLRGQHIGLIVIDEFQEILALGKQRRQLLQLLINLRDEGNVPILVVGTTKTFKLFKSELAAARRVGGGGSFQLIRPLSADDEIFRTTAERAWKYQWVRRPVEFSNNIAATLYECCQGITGIMIDVFVHAQRLAMQLDEDDPCYETVNEDTLRRAYANMPAIHAAMNALGSGDPILMDKYEDLMNDTRPKPEDLEDEQKNAEGRSEDQSALDVFAAHQAAVFAQSQGKPSSSKGPKAGPKSEPIAQLSPEQIRVQVLGTDSMDSLIEAFRE